MSDDNSQDPEGIDTYGGGDEPSAGQDGKGPRRRDIIQTVCAVIVAAAAAWQTLRGA